MRITVLVDNNTLIDSYFAGEPGLSLLVEHGDARVLFDAGHSDAFVRNARSLDEDLTRLDWVALSHGHLDHTWGLGHLAALYTDAARAGRPRPRPVLAAHPRTFDSRRSEQGEEIGARMTWESAARFFTPAPDEGPRELAPGLYMLGEVPRALAFEPPTAIGTREDGTPDLLPDDTALACVTPAGLVVVTGCAHAGVCNTVEHARAVTGTHRVRAVLGGMHLLDASAERLAATADYLGALDLEDLYPCHCTDLAAKLALSARCPVREMGAGQRVAFD